MTWQTTLQQDLKSLGLSQKWKLRYVVTHRVAYFMLLLRLAEDLKPRTGLWRLLYISVRIKYDRLSERLGFDIPLMTFGPGLSIAHRGTIVVNGEARIGANCRIHPGVTIGAINGLSPVIGDDVFIGPGVGVYGPITIGNNCVLGPNSLINFSVADFQTTFGSRATLKQSVDTALSPFHETPWHAKRTAKVNED